MDDRAKVICITILALNLVFGIENPTQLPPANFDSIDGTNINIQTCKERGKNNITHVNCYVKQENDGEISATCDVNLFKSVTVTSLEINLFRLENENFLQSVNIHSTNLCLVVPELQGVILSLIDENSTCGKGKMTTGLKKIEMNMNQVFKEVFQGTRLTGKYKTNFIFMNLTDIIFCFEIECTFLLQ